MYRMYGLAVAAGTMLFAVSATAQQVYCTDRASALKRLASEYAEAPVAMGLANNGGVVEILANKDGETWTILITSPRGVSCLVAAGEYWEPITNVALGPES